jgi:hypothetical protein
MQLTDLLAQQPSQQGSNAGRTVVETLMQALCAFEEHHIHRGLANVYA